VLFALAEVIGSSLPELYRSATNWNYVVVAAAESLTSQFEKVQVTADATSIWGRVLLDLDVKRLNKSAAAVTNSITQQLEAAVTSTSSYDGANYLTAKHAQAVQWIREVGVRRGLVDFQNTTTFPIRAHYNPKGNDYCASSSLFVGEIGWNLQLVERSLYGALILEMLFEHEYLSHMLPRNNHLSKNVREVWLSAALFWEHDNEPIDQATRQVRAFLWERFRRELGRFFDPKDIEFFGPLKLDHVAERIRFFSEEIFWDITKAILECPDTKENVVDRLLRQLTDLSPQELRAGLGLGSGNWHIIKEFHEELGI
jgi:hypothetical protein